MQSQRIKQTSKVPVFVDNAVERQQDEAEYQAIVLEMAVVDQNGIGFDEQQKQKDLRQLLLELVCEQIDGGEEADQVH